MTRGLLTAKDIRRLLAAHQLAPRKASGQNFVVDPNIVRKVVRDAQVGPGDLVLEIGPGLGSLTLALREAGARVIALEMDAGLVRALREVVGADEQIRVIHGDALRIGLGDLVDGGPAALVANLPYNIATPVVLEALKTRAFSRLLVMVQREVGERWAAGPGDPRYGAVSVKIRAQADAKVVGAVGRGAFYPAPNVDSVTVRLDPVHWRLGVEQEALFALIDRGFAQRRKRLRNALSVSGLTPAEIEQALTDAGLDPGARAEELDLAQWGDLARQLGAVPD
ncbi:MAG TPA: 16S rRNA (adenine(1518)-N(6)/adenine(1519)-N(6))-dimethyltransferase RsmA [Egibacteraceae bacterium]|nr:16S rRNA (adenine(1518)-N(6)/adenine(1519)-N(6))-dimethyltransferase RsmA [Egibacteraceae bacterium]